MSPQSATLGCHLAAVDLLQTWLRAFRLLWLLSCCGFGATAVGDFVKSPAKSGEVVNAQVRSSASCLNLGLAVQARVSGESLTTFPRMIDLDPPQRAEKASLRAANANCQAQKGARPADDVLNC